MNKLAIIPARRGSKRIPRKNIKDFLGKPIIAYSIEAALQSKLFDEVMVSTDDKEIAEIAIKYGASVPFLRSKKNSDDFATTADVLIEVLKEYEELGTSFDFFCCIYPTAPFITINNLAASFELLKHKNFDSVFPVVQFSYPIQRSLKISGSKASMFWPENYNSRSQDLEPAYHDSGQFYWMKTEIIVEQKIVFTNNSGIIILDNKQVQDIDSKEDWAIAEMKYKLRENESSAK